MQRVDQSEMQYLSCNRLLLQGIQLVAIEARAGRPKNERSRLWFENSSSFRQGATEIGCGDMYLVIRTKRV